MPTSKEQKQKKSGAKSPGLRQTSEWHHVDAQGKILGRLATDIAYKLQGKHRTDYVPHLVAPVYMVVTRTDEIVVTGEKENRKVYRWYSGYPGGLKERSFKEQRQRDSRRLIWLAVYGMLPKNSLREKRMRHLKLYRGSEHPHEAQLGNPVTPRKSQAKAVGA